MEVVADNTTTAFEPVYIPHHPVLREDSRTTKLRVVFNASCKTNNGSTLNDYLMTGPKLQSDLSPILLRWRHFRYVYTADIEKMFRQIRLHPDDTDFLRIFWRSQEDRSIQSYKLSTVTYGTAPAPYLAMRVLKQLSLDDGHLFPRARQILQNSLYVDDVLFGADDITFLRECRMELTELLMRGGFHLCKWASNSKELLMDIPSGKHELAIDLPFDQEDALKILGLTWMPLDDSFRFHMAPCPSALNTKRAILSFIAKLFDPLGWVSPVIITAKLMIQELWIRKYNWDSTIDTDLLGPWEKYCTELVELQRIRVTRWTGMQPNIRFVELHGFADASNRAYAAVVYLRLISASNDISVVLLTAKSKVAPIKTISIPRLELNATVLLTRLLEFVINSLKLQHLTVYGWTDSSVVLAWLRGHLSKWTTYVANRVSDIQTRLPLVRWNHVRSNENPADCASRGLPPSELPDFKLWWHGPDWLSSPSTEWPSRCSINTDSNWELIDTETRKACVSHILPEQEWVLPNEISSWTKLMRITALLRRFVSNLRCLKTKSALNLESLSASELKEASLFWFRYVQQNHFPSEMLALRNGKSIPRSSALLSFSPFLGEDQLIRLGGRIENSPLSFNERHPIIIPQHRIAELLIANAHSSALHGGTQLR